MFPSILIILRIIIAICLVHVCVLLKAQTNLSNQLLITEPLAALPPGQPIVRHIVSENFSELAKINLESAVFENEQESFVTPSVFSTSPKSASPNRKRVYGPLTTHSIETFAITKSWKTEKSAGASITKTLSGFINMGFSGKNFYPKCRAGFSISTSLSKSFEVEAGMRYLSFGNSSQVYTGYFGKFYNNFLFGVRTFVTPANRGTSHSYSFISRYYIKGSNDFFSLCLGSGIASDDKTLNIQFINKKRINSRLAAAGYSHNLSKTNVLSVNAAWVNHDYRSAFLTKQIDISAGFKRLF